MPKPTVILDAPCAGLRDAIASIAPVFLFQRKGGFLTTTASAAGEELKEALAAGNVGPPYILVSASYGGFTALAYAARFPVGLAGLVLVDPSHPEQGASVAAAIPPDELRLPAVAAFKNYMQGFGPIWTESCETMAGIRELVDVPMIVLAAGRPDMPMELSEGTRRELTRGWHALQRRHVSLSTRGELRIVPGVGHNIAAAAPELVVAAVLELVEQTTSQND